jgi:hypothetical protein
MIQSFTVLHRRGRIMLSQLFNTINYASSRENSLICDRLCTESQTSNARIQELSTNHHLDAELKGIWFHKLFEPCPLFDGALSLLLCLAPKITRVQLNFSAEQPLPMTTYLIGSVDWRWTAIETSHLLTCNTFRYSISIPSMNMHGRS